MTASKTSERNEGTVRIGGAPRGARDRQYGRRVRALRRPVPAWKPLALGMPVLLLVAVMGSGCTPSVLAEPSSVVHTFLLTPDDDVTNRKADMSRALGSGQILCSPQRGGECA
jgi:hypothetical protein